MMKSKFRCLAWVAISATALIFISVAKTGLPAFKKENSVMALSIESAAFMPAHEIPVRHTCDGLDISPPLAWTGVPAAAKSLALILDDPDAPDPVAPRMVWVHWVLYNLPADIHGLEEGAKGLPAQQGMNDWHQPGYRGPCPPAGKHRYFFRLYALDTMLPDMQCPEKSVLEKAMRNHILAQSELVGLYQKH